MKVIKNVNIFLTHLHIKWLFLKISRKFYNIEETEIKRHASQQGDGSKRGLTWRLVLFLVILLEWFCSLWSLCWKLACHAHCFNRYLFVQSNSHWLGTCCKSDHAKKQQISSCPWGGHREEGTWRSELENDSTVLCIQVF